MPPTLESWIQILSMEHCFLLMTLTHYWQWILCRRISQYMFPRLRMLTGDPQEKMGGLGGGLWQIRVECLGLNLVVEPGPWTLKFLPRLRPKHEGVRWCRIKPILWFLMVFMVPYANDSETLNTKHQFSNTHEASATAPALFVSHTSQGAASAVGYGHHAG